MAIILGVILAWLVGAICGVSSERGDWRKATGFRTHEAYTAAKEAGEKAKGPPPPRL